MGIVMIRIAAICVAVNGALYMENMMTDEIEAPPMTARITEEQAKRFEFLEFRLDWEDRVNRRDLMEAFGISEPQASVDFRAYNTARPDAMAYNKFEKRYRATTSFDPAFYAPDAQHYLSILCPESAEDRPRQPNWIGSPPPLAMARKLPRKPIEATVLRAVLQAIEYGREIEARYQSSTHKAEWRWFRPIGLVYSGFRWHCRAWDTKNSRFGDFVLTRILDVRSHRPAVQVPATDPEWDQSVSVMITVDPGINEGARSVLAEEYGISSGEPTTMAVGRLVLPYFLRLNGIEEDNPRQRPEQRQIIVANRNDVTAALPDGWKVPPCRCARADDPQ